MSKPLALGAHIFQGMFSHGVQAAGFNILAHLEAAEYGVPTAKLNFPGLDVRVGSFKEWRVEEFTGKVDLQYCNPACAAWSQMRQSETANHWSDQTDRLQWIRDCVAIGLIVRPRAWCWESVAGAWSKGHSFVLEQAYRWTDAGYNATVLLEDAGRLGVPQRRHRMFLLAHQHPLVWPTLVNPPTVRATLSALRRGDLGKLPEIPAGLRPKPLSAFWQRLWADSAKHGNHLARAFDELSAAEVAEYKRASGGTNVFKPLGATVRLQLDRPAPVMLSGATRYHPTEPRLLDLNEWKALCTLPLSWQTSLRRYENATIEMARAVMPGVGEWLATAVLNGLDRPRLKEPVITYCDFRYAGRDVTQVLWKHGQPKLQVEAPRAAQASFGDAFSRALVWPALQPVETEAQRIRRLCF